MSPYNIQQFGNNLKKLRAESGYTHEDVETISSRYGFPVAQPTQSKLENGRGSELPGGRILLGLAYVYGTNPTDLLGYAEPGKERDALPKRVKAATPTPNSALTLSRRALRLAKMIDALPEDMYKQAVQFVQQLFNLAALNRQRNLFYIKDVLALIEEGLDPELKQRVLKAFEKAGIMDGRVVYGNRPDAEPVGLPQEPVPG